MCAILSEMHHLRMMYEYCDETCDQIKVSDKMYIDNVI